MNCNFKPLAGTLVAALLLTFAVPAVRAEQMSKPQAPQDQSQEGATPSQGMGTMNPGMMGKPPADGPMTMGGMGMMNMMGMMRMCPMMGGMMGHMMGGADMMMGFGGPALSDRQLDRINKIREELFQKETALMQQMFKARLKAQKDAYAVLAKEQKAQFGSGWGMMGR